MDKSIVVITITINMILDPYSFDPYSYDLTPIHMILDPYSLANPLELKTVVIRV